MSGKSNIIDKLREMLAIAAQRGQRGVILQPGAIGDCILTLPLAELMKETVCPGGVDIIGHTEYLGMLPGRSCVDAVRSLDSMSLHRLFAGEGDFELADGDPLIMAFAGYSWIASFLGEPDSHFEKNLIFTVNCSNSAEVMTLAMKPDAERNIHVGDFYRKQFIEQSGFDALTAGGLLSQEHNSAIGMPLIRPTQADIYRGKEILAENGIMPTKKPVVIHPGSGGAHKCWHLDNFLSVAKMLAKEGAEVVFLLGPAEAERFSESAITEIRTAGKLLTNLSLVEVLGILGCSRGYIGNDSGITHLAAAVGIRTVVVFGPTDPAIYAPIGPAVSVLRNDSAAFTDIVSQEMKQQICDILLA
jgi:heptosyltransferase-2